MTTPNLHFAYALWIAFWYVAGSIPFGLLVAKAGCGIDPRLSGSRNIGATNVARLCGFKFGLATLFLDIAKAAVPVLLTRTFSSSPVLLSLVAAAPIFGHMYSAFLGGQGGKAVATTIGAFLALTPIPLLIAVALCVLAILLSGFVSVGSLTLVLTLPFLLFFLHQPHFIPLALAVMLAVLWRHRENIRRLARGQEKSWRKGKQA